MRSEEERRRERLHIRRFVKRGTEREHLHCVFLLFFCRAYIPHDVMALVDASGS